MRRFFILIGTRSTKIGYQESGRNAMNRRSTISCVTAAYYYTHVCDKEDRIKNVTHPNKGVFPSLYRCKQFSSCLINFTRCIMRSPSVSAGGGWWTSFIFRRCPFCSSSTVCYGRTRMQITSHRIIEQNRPNKKNPTYISTYYTFTNGSASFDTL